MLLLLSLVNDRNDPVLREAGGRCFFQCTAQLCYCDLRRAEILPTSMQRRRTTLKATKTGGRTLKDRTSRSPYSSVNHPAGYAAAPDSRRAQAARSVKALAARGQPGCQIEYALWLEDPRRCPVREESPRSEPRLALQLLLRCASSGASDGNWMRAALHATRLLLNEGSESAAKRAVGWLWKVERAAGRQAGEGQQLRELAHRLLAFCYREGRGVPQSAEKASLLLSIAPGGACSGPLAAVDAILRDCVGRLGC